MINPGRVVLLPTVARLNPHLHVGPELLWVRKRWGMPAMPIETAACPSVNVAVGNGLLYYISKGEPSPKWLRSYTRHPCRTWA